jgi:hypothetical protein
VIKALGESLEYWSYSAVKLGELLGRLLGERVTEQSLEGWLPYADRW